jgi:ribosomal protein L40E
MIIRLIIAIIVVVVALKLYKRIFKQKTCDTCHQRIAKEAEVCHHCNTIQQKES